MNITVYSSNPPVPGGCIDLQGTLRSIPLDRFFTGLAGADRILVGELLLSPYTHRTFARIGRGMT